MAGYGYTSSGSYTRTTYSGAAPPRTDGRSKTSYTSDQVSQPVFVAAPAADGRRKPIMSYSLTGDTESHVIKTEIVVELPCVYRYRQSSPVKVVVMGFDDDKEGKWIRLSSPACYHGAEQSITRYSNRS